MTSLELSEKLYREYFMTIIDKELPEAIPYFATGLSGEGSDCFGYDDEISMDHDYAVRLCVWMERKDAEHFGEAMTTVFRKMPDKLNGRRIELCQAGKSGLIITEDYYRHFLGEPTAPQTNQEWMKTDETLLASAVNGMIFTKTEVSFTMIRRQLLKYYPEDVRLLRLAKAVGLAAQAGQYNYSRILKRGDGAAAEMAKNIFIESIIQVVFLLRKTYRPFYKWSFRKMKDLGEDGGKMALDLEYLYSLRGEAAVACIEDISARIVTEMQRQQLTDSDSDFLMDHLPELGNRIQDTSLLKNGISLVH